MSMVKSKLALLLLLTGCMSTPRSAAEYDTFNIDGGAYPVTINVIVTPNTELAAQYVRDNLDSSVTACDFDGAAALTFDFQEGKPGIIWLESATFDPEDIGIINHELLHATINTMNYSGVSLSSESAEAYTYQLEFYSNQFYKQIK